MNDKEFYIFGIPVETELCKVRFLKYHEYVQYLPELSTISLNVLHIYYQYKNNNTDNNPEVDAILNQLKEDSLYNIVINNSMFAGAYLKIFRLVIEEDSIIEKIFDDESLFMRYRQLVLDMQMLVEEEVNSNPEIQRSLERSRRVKQNEAEKTSFSDIVSAVVAGTSNSFKDVTEMTVLQLYAVYYRMSAIFEYSTTTLFATVTDKVKISSWGKHIDLWARESNTIDKNEFEKKFGNML